MAYMPINEVRQETIKKAREMINDPRIGSDTTLGTYCQNASSILMQGARSGRLSEAQVEYLVKTYDVYQRIKAQSVQFEELREPTAALIQEIADLTAANSKGNRSLSAYGGNAVKRVHQIRGGEYFWSFHLDSPKSALLALKAKGVDIGDLERRVDGLSGKLKVETSWG